MVYVLFLLTEELRTDGIEGVATKLILTLHVLEYIYLQATIKGRIF